MPADDRVRRPAVKHVKKEKERDVVDRNVLALKKSGKVGDEEKEVRKRVGSSLGGGSFFLVRTVADGWVYRFCRCGMRRRE